MLKIKLNKDIKDKIETGYLKAKELVQFVVDNTECTIEEDKNINTMALQNIKLNGKSVKGAKIDIEENLLILTF